MRFVWEEIKFFHFAVEGISGKEINLKNVKRESADPRYVEVWMTKLPSDDGGFERCQSLQLFQHHVGGLRVRVKVELGHAVK